MSSGTPRKLYVRIITPILIELMKNEWLNMSYSCPYQMLGQSLENETLFIIKDKNIKEISPKIIRRLDTSLAAPIDCFFHCNPQLEIDRRSQNDRSVVSQDTVWPWESSVTAYTTTDLVLSSNLQKISVFLSRKSSISVPHICEAKIPPIIGCVCFIMSGDNDHAEWKSGSRSMVKLFWWLIRSTSKQLQHNAA